MANDSCDVFGGSIVKPNNTESLNTLEISELYAFAIVHLTICLIGIFGNILSLSVLKRNRFLQTVPNAYIAHLAATDLCVCFTIPVQVTQLFFGTESNSTWDTFPDELCVIIGHILVIMNSSTLIAMMMIAINRYILILKGRTLYNKIYTKRNTTISIIISWCWVLAFTTAIPQAANLSSFGYNYKFGVCIFKSYCFKSYVYAGIFLTIPIFLPVTIATGVSYTLIIRKLIRVRRKLYRTNPQKPNLRLNRKAGDGDTALDNIDSGVEVSHYDSPQKEQANNQESDTESEMDFVDNDEDEEQVKTVNAITKSSEQQTQSIAVKRTAGASNIQHQTSEDRGLMASTEEANQMESSFQTQPKEKLHKASSSPVEESPASPTPFVRSKSFIRRLSPAKIRIRSATLVARLRRPKWKKHCLAIVNMITIYLVMWICWLPIILLYSIDWQGKVSAVGYKVTVTLMYLNSSFNVLLYAMMNNSHRKALILQLSRTCKCK